MTTATPTVCEECGDEFAVVVLALCSDCLARLDDAGSES